MALRGIGLNAARSRKPQTANAASAPGGEGLFAHVVRNKMFHVFLRIPSLPLYSFVFRASSGGLSLTTFHKFEN